MADYQSLLTRAVANLPSTSSAETRQAIYDRARKALLTQLRTLRPPLPESDISREEKALDQAIALVEAKFGGANAARLEPPPANPAPPAAPVAPGASRPPGGSSAAAAAPRAAQPGQPSPAPAVRPQSTPSPPAPARAPSGTPVAQEPLAAMTGVAQHSPAGQLTHPRSAPPRPPAPSSAQQVSPAAAPKPPQSPASVPINPPEPRGVQGAAALKAPSVRTERVPQQGEASSLAAPFVAGRRESSTLSPSNLARVIPSAETNAGGSSAPPVIARIEDEADLGGVPEVPVDMDRPGSQSRPDTGGQRPHAPTAVTEKSKSWLWLALAVVLGAVLSVAGAAIVMRQKPQDLAVAPPEPQQEATQPPAKIAQRAQPSPTDDNSAAPSESAPQASQSTAQGGQEPANPPLDSAAGALPSAARAAMLIASPDNPQKPVVNLGSTVWSTIPAAPGQPATVAVKADADIPDLKMHATMTLRKNTDPTLEATHTIDLKFSFADGAPITGFKDVGTPQMRKLDSTASETLTSVKVKISDVYFLIALAKGEQETAGNLDLMQTRAWFDFPLLLNDNRIAKLVFQKSSEGETMLAKAFEAWK